MTKFDSVMSLNDAGYVNYLYKQTVSKICYHYKSIEIFFTGQSIAESERLIPALAGLIRLATRIASMVIQISRYMLLIFTNGKQSIREEEMISNGAI